MDDNREKVKWSGIILSVQPRTTVWRYVLDNRTHYHIGYNLFLDGEVNGLGRNFAIAISEKQQQVNEFRIDDEVKGTAWTKMYDVSDYADFYRAGGLKIIKRAEANQVPFPPPYRIPVPDLAVYKWRGARMLSVSCWKGKCFQCAWANMAAVEIEYNWGISKKYRFESFCYGPKSCKLYKMGRPRGVPYKNRGTFYDEGWRNDIITENRGMDD